MEQKVKKVHEATVEELKARAYDLVRGIERARIEIEMIEQELVLRTKKQPVEISKEPKKEEKKEEKK